MSGICWWRVQLCMTRHGIHPSAHKSAFDSFLIHVQTLSIEIDRKAILHCNQTACNTGRDIEAENLCGLRIYVNLGIVVRIERMGIDESSDMRDYLCVGVLQTKYRDMLSRPVGDVLVWDRRGAWHCAVAD